MVDGGAEKYFGALKKIVVLEYPERGGRGVGGVGLATDKLFNCKI